MHISYTSLKFATSLLVLATAVPTSMWGQTVHADTIHADSVSADSISADSARHTPRYTNIGISTSSTTADGHRVKTFNLGLLAAADTLSGFQLSLISGAGKMCGVQTGAVQTVAREMKGVQLSALNNIAGNNMRGLQLGGVSNMAGSVERGLQVSPLLNLSTGVMRGVQIGSYNYADSLRGVQLGVINIAVTHPRGVQMGLVNYTADTGGRKIGLVNINPSTRIDILAFGGNTSKLNAAVRFSNRSIYSMLGVGTHYMGLDKKFSGALSYRLGQYVWLTPHWMLGADLGFSHIETFAERSSDRPHRLYSLQAHLNTEWRFCKSVGAFASVGYGNTRHYGSGRLYEEKLILQAGLAFTWPRATQQPFSLRRSVLGDALSQGDPYTLSADSCFALAPRRRPWLAAVEAAGINALVFSYDRWIANASYSRISLHSIRHNFKTGFV